MSSMGQIRQGVKGQTEEVRLNRVDNREPMKLSSKGRGVLKAVAFKEG